MSGVDEILSYKKNPDEDFYALLNCDEHSSVSRQTTKGLHVGGKHFFTS